MSTARQCIKLAQSLPPQLQRLFARYPPLGILPGPPSPSNASNTASKGLNLASATTSGAAITETFNPFKPTKSPITGRWHNPVYSLRRQADLVKLARQHGVEELLPHTIKGTGEKLRRRLENGLRVKGTGVGQKVKGKLSERTLKSRLEKRRQAMLAMPQMIQTWKERGHGRGWKKWPK